MRDKWGREVADVPRPAHYGGNRIPKSYLDKFNADTHAWLVRIGARAPGPVGVEAFPADIAMFVKGEL